MGLAGGLGTWPEPPASSTVLSDRICLVPVKSLGNSWVLPLCLGKEGRVVLLGTSRPRSFPWRLLSPSWVYPSTQGVGVVASEEWFL